MLRRNAKAHACETKGIPSARNIGLVHYFETFAYICKDSFSLADALNTCISVEVDGSPNRHAPLDGWFDSDTPQMFGRFFFSFFPGASIEAAMPRELAVNLLNGDAFTLDVTSIDTVQEVKWMLREKFCDDPIEQKILKVDLLKDSDLLDDSQTLNEPGLHAEAEVTVIYRRNEVEAATRYDVHTQEFCQVNIPQTVRLVSEEAFKDCSHVVKVTIPDSVTEIGGSAFRGCTSLESINIPNSVTQIGSCAFEGCTSLEIINIPNSVTQIGSCAFKGCTSVKSILLPDSVTEIGIGAFANCTSLESITIPDWVTVIPRGAFERCTSLKASPFLVG